MANEQIEQIDTSQEAQNAARALVERLSPRERQVLECIAQGQTSPQIAAYLGISRYTVGAHRMSAMQKLDLHNRQQVTLFAVRAGLVEL